MSRFNELKQQFAAGDMTRDEFIEQMNAEHRRLFDYATWLRDSELSAIEISADQVVAVSRDGLRFILDRRDRRSPPLEVLNFGCYEVRDARLFFSLLEPNQVVLDIGAHIGWYALHVAGRFPDSQVHAFEPVPASFAQLEKHVALNGLENLATHPYALGDTEGAVSFFVDPSYPTAASAKNILESPTIETVHTTVRRLDDLDLQPDVIKIDVEGGELGVLRGGRATLERCRPAVFCEMLRKWSAKFGCHPNDTIRFMADLGYACVTDDSDATNELRRVETMSDEESATNFVFLHRERHAERLA